MGGSQGLSLLGLLLERSRKWAGEPGDAMRSGRLSVHFPLFLRNSYWSLRWAQVHLMRAGRVVGAPVGKVPGTLR